MQELFTGEISAELQERGNQCNPSQELLFRRIQLGALQQGSDPFEEITVDFTEEEWELLDSGQRTLCREVTLDAFRNMSALGDLMEKEKQGRSMLLHTLNYEVEVMFDHQGNPETQERSHSEGGEEKISTSHSFSLTLPKNLFWKHKPHTIVKLGKVSGLNRKAKICTKYGNNFSSKTSLNGHQRIHTGERIYKRLDYGKRFFDNKVLTHHQWIHTGDKPYKCLECGKSFHLRSSINRHERIHRGEKKYRYNKCGKRFFENRSFIIHKRIHIGERPYKCLECGKSFFDNKVLTRHQWIHTRDKPYKCFECGKSFIHKGQLNSHKRVHTGETV
ncbi:zinc finger protein 2-like [Pantherophis guttatus]|uniref:Zinc finger protein 2-like n=1 Tax=Pantherophis guttatus TaxID=94885 RepID=A0A6P9CNV3_PANGU|nr:zinc finger protein 2-like [Pantherophis guttatus]XP_060549460.1 zinc finger protein 2-like [Pantherophis guttatus]